MGARAASGRACAVERGTPRSWCGAEAAGGAALRGRVSWCGEPGERVLPSRRPLCSVQCLNLVAPPQRGVTSGALNIALRGLPLGRVGVWGSGGEGASGGFPRFFSICADSRCWLEVLEPRLPGRVGLALSLRARLSPVSCSPSLGAAVRSAASVISGRCACRACSACGWRSCASAEVSRRAFLWEPLGGWQPPVPLYFV